jgi:hypothetical protein
VCNEKVTSMMQMMGSDTMSTDNTSGTINDQQQGTFGLIRMFDLTNLKRQIFLNGESKS